MITKDRKEFDEKLEQFIRVYQTGGNIPGIVQYPPRHVDFYLTNTPKDNCVNYLTSVEDAKDIVSVIDIELNRSYTGNIDKIVNRAKSDSVDLVSKDLYFVLEF